MLIIGSFRRASHSERSCALFYKRWRTHLRVFSSPNKHWKGFSSSTTIVRSVLLHVLGVLARESCLIGNYSKRQLIPSSRCCSSARVCVCGGFRVYDMRPPGGVVSSPVSLRQSVCPHSSPSTQGGLSPAARSDSHTLAGLSAAFEVLVVGKMIRPSSTSLNAR